MYAVVTGSCAELVRELDGEVREICFGPDWIFGSWLFFTSRELWAVLRESGGSGNFTVRRVPMPDW